MKTAIPPSYRTDNLFVASFLMARGSKFTGVEPIEESHRRYLYFLFEDNGQINAYEKDYLNNAQIQVGSFVNAVNTLRGVIRKHYRGNNRVE